MAGRSCAVKELGNKPGTKNFVVMRKQSDLLAGLSREQYVSEQVSLKVFQFWKTIGSSYCNGWSGCLRISVFIIFSLKNQGIGGSSGIIN